MEIQELHQLDAQHISDLLALMTQLNPRLHVTPEMLQATVQDPATHLFAAMEQGRIVGCASLCVSHSPTGRKGRIEDVVVSSACRGQGLGRRLMQHLVDFARAELSPIVLNLTSKPEREAANRLYRALGFQPYDTNVYKLPLSEL